MKLGEWLRDWYELYVAGTDLAPSTQGMYRRSIEALPAWLLSIELEQLTPLDVYRHVKTRAKSQPRAAQLDRVTLARAIKVAAKCGLMTPLVIDRDTCPMPQHKAKKTLVLSLDEAMLYMDAAATSPAAPLLMLCLCGLRRGEALGVRWRDVDLDEGILHVTGQRQRVAGGYVWRRLKTEKSERVFALPEHLHELMRTWPRTLRSPFICDMTPEQLQREHVEVIRVTGLPRVTLHGLRHTFATLAAAQGVPMKQIQVAMGHASYQLTADLYADHLSPLSGIQRQILRTTGNRVWAYTPPRVQIPNSPPDGQS